MRGGEANKDTVKKSPCPLEGCIGATDRRLLKKKIKKILGCYACGCTEIKINKIFCFQRILDIKIQESIKQNLLAFIVKQLGQNTGIKWPF